MIHGIISVQTTINGASSIVISAFSECFQFTSQKLKKSCNHYQDHLKHTYSEESSIGIMIGDFQTRSLFCSHFGNMNECEQIAADFLFNIAPGNIEEFVYANAIFLKETIRGPYLLVLIEGSQIILVTSYGEGDFEIRTMPPGNFCIK